MRPSSAQKSLLDVKLQRNQNETHEKEKKS